MKELKKVRRVFLVAGFLLVSFWAAVLALGRLPDSLEVTGIVEAKKVYPVTSAVTGILNRIVVEEGDRVVEGDVIAAFEERSFSERERNAALDVARWELEIDKIESELRALDRLAGMQDDVTTARNSIAEAKLNHSKSVLKRKKTCSDDSVLPLTELEKAEIDYEVAAGTLNLERLTENLKEQELKDRIDQKMLEHSQAVLEHKQATLGHEKAKADLGACLLVAPVSGTIMRVDFRPGDLLERGIRLTTVVCDRDLIFTAFVDDEDMARMQVGLPAEVTMDAFPHRSYGIFCGRVEAIAPGADLRGEAPCFRATLSLEAWWKEVQTEPGAMKMKVFLRPGQKGKAKIILRPSMPVMDLLFEKASGHL